MLMFRFSLFAPGLMLFRCDLFLIFFQRHQVVEFTSRLDLDFDHPAFAVRVSADLRRILDELFVDAHHFTVHGGVKLADGLDRFDLPEAVALKNMIADIRQVDDFQP